jgi:hypothetical protein
VKMIDLALDMIRRLTSVDTRTRELAADEVTDVVKSLGGLGSVIAGVLAIARLGESDPSAQEAQLHALSELDEWGLVPSDVREILARIDLTTVEGSQVEYLEDLLGTS